MNPKLYPKAREDEALNIVQLIGGSGAGKGAIAVHLAQLWPGRATHMRTNRYLQDRLPGDGADFIMLPSSVDWPLVSLHIESLARGERVIMPDYNWQAGRRLPPRPAQTSNLSLEPTDLLLIDSLFLVPFPLDSVKIYVDTPKELRRQHVHERDVELNGNFLDHFDTITEPNFQKYTAPLRKQCGLVLDGTRPADRLAAQTQRYLTSIWGGWG